MSQTLRNLLIAGALALVGIILTTSYINGQRRDLSRGTEQVRVLVAKKDIPAGTPAKNLEEGGFLEHVDVERKSLVPRALSDVKDIKNLSTNQTIYKGEPLSGHQFETRSSLNPADQIKGTERLVSLQIMPLGTVADLVKPGDHIDIFASAKINSEVCTWIAARDVVIVQTPDSLASSGEGEEAAANAPIQAKDDPQLYVVQASDKVVQDLQWSYAFADDSKLIYTVRPSEGDQETKLPMKCSAPATN